MQAPRWSRPMAIWGTLDLISQQLASNPRFDAALAYLAEALKPGVEYRLLVEASSTKAEHDFILPGAGRAR